MPPSSRLISAPISLCGALKARVGVRAPEIALLFLTTFGMKAAVIAGRQR